MIGYWRAVPCAHSYNVNLPLLAVIVVIGVDSGGSPGTRPPIIRMGETPFLPPNNQTRIFYFVYLKKINMKESRNRDNNTKKTEHILNERCKFCKKVVDD